MQRIASVVQTVGTRKEIKVFGYNWTFQGTKALVTLLIAVLMGLGTAIGSGSIDDLGTSDWVQAIVLLLTGSVIVGLLDNIPGYFGGVIKAVVGAAVAGLTAWQVAFENDHVVSQGEWLAVAIAVVTGLAAVYQIPDGPDDPDGPLTVARNQGG